MNRKKKITIMTGAILFVLTIALVLCLVYRIALRSTTGGRAHGVEVVISFYIMAKNGDFPTSEDDLIKEHFLRKTVTASEAEYSIRSMWFDDKNPESEKGWQPFSYFDLFTIGYGASTDNIEIIDGKLYDRSTHEQVFLIDGPYKESLKKIYEESSLSLYKLMLQEKK